MASRKRVFSAVFPSSSQITTPTPLSTPQIGTGSFASSSFDYPDAAPAYAEDSATERIRWERAWSSATSFLSIPNASITLADATGSESSLRGKWVKQFLPGVANQMIYLVHGGSIGRRLRTGKKQDDLLYWYTQEIGTHYTQFQLPLLLSILKGNNESKSLSEFLRVLQITQVVYLYPLKQCVLPQMPDDGDYEYSNFRETYHAMIAKSLGQSSFSDYLRQFLKEQGSIVLGLGSRENVYDEESMTDDPLQMVAEARGRTKNVMKRINDVGLGGAKAQRIFAEVMSELLTEHVNTTYANQWASPSTIPTQLRTWVEDHFARYAVELLACLDGSDESLSEKATQVTLADVVNWQQKAINDLGALRLKELFDVIVDWGEHSMGAIEDLKQYITTIPSRSHLTDHFSAVISHRLLQPGASTTQILQLYMRIIRAFALLDPKGVLLDRLARPIRRYLRDRDDTVKIIVSGLLSDDADDVEAQDTLAELAQELKKATGDVLVTDDDGETDWDDMSWVPDPIDAGTDYKKSKNLDVIGTMMTLFDNKEVFVREFQNIMGDRLLRQDFNLEKETKVLELLKLRFGEAPLQACEVMLRDVLDSRRTDALIHKSNVFNSPVLSNAPTGMHAKILSRLFWPALNAETFALPPPIHSLHEHYSRGFEAVKPTRKLAWIPALGHATVELHLDDRTITTDVQTWQASVIYAFHDPSPQHGPVTKTVADLAAALAMDPALVLNALTFWVGKLVLRQTGPTAYTVLERLSSADAATADGATQATVAAAAAAASVASVASAVRADEDVVGEKMGVFQQFIVGMLTNQGAMPLARIKMMLGYAVPGGFPFGEGELREFLERLKEEGRVEAVGGSWRIVKS